MKCFNQFADTTIRNTDTAVRNAATVRNTADGAPNTTQASNRARLKLEKTTGALVFGALLIVCSIVCSITVGCSSDNPKTPNATNSGSGAQSSTPAMVANSSTPPEPRPIEQKAPAKKVVKKRPATVTYVNQDSGISFDYPRRYAIETGDAAADLVESIPVPANFIAPGGTALVAVELPETGFANTDFSSAFFGVSVNNSIKAEDCGKFAVPPSESAKAETVTAASAATLSSTATVASIAREAANSTEHTADASPVVSKTQDGIAPSESTARVMLKEMDVQKAEAVSGDGTRQSDSKYFHVYQNNACYEFALNVTTAASQSDGEMKHIDRDKVFAQLEKILATVKINPVEATEKADSAPMAAAPVAAK